MSIFQETSHNRVKERCKQGHLLQSANLRIKRRTRKHKDGSEYLSIERECIECHRLDSKVSYWRLNRLAPGEIITRSSFRSKYAGRSEK